MTARSGWERDKVRRIISYLATLLSLGFDCIALEPFTFLKHRGQTTYITLSLSLFEKNGMPTSSDLIHQKWRQESSTGAPVVAEGGGPLYALPVQHKRPSKRLLRDNIRPTSYRLVVMP